MSHSCGVDRAPEIAVRHLARDARLTYYLYVPEHVGPDTPVFVTVHGISRNAEQHAHLFAPYCAERGIILVAPLFSPEMFPRYQRLGREGKGERSDKVLNEILAQMGEATGASTERIYLFGFSGGGQFAHRYAMAYPDRVSSYVVGAAGWYTFPDVLTRFPRGLSPRDDLPDVRFDMRRFLAVPGSVIVGERDIKVGRALNQSERIKRQQGVTRLERGHRWIDEMRRASKELGLGTPFGLHILPRCGHSFVRGMTRCGMGSLVFRSLFDALQPVVGGG